MQDRPRGIISESFQQAVRSWKLTEAGWDKIRLYHAFPGPGPAGPQDLIRSYSEETDYSQTTISKLIHRNKCVILSPLIRVMEAVFFPMEKNLNPPKLRCIQEKPGMRINRYLIKMQLRTCSAVPKPDIFLLIRQAPAQAAKSSLPN